MPTPQAIAGATGPFQYHLEFTLKPDVSAASAVQATSRLWDASVTGRGNAGVVSALEPAAGATGLVVGFGPQVWAAVAPSDVPSGFREAYPIQARDGRGVPATQRDIWVWLNGSSYDLVLSAALEAVRLLADVATVAAEQRCAVHEDNRTWEGFIDGTENPGPFEIPDIAYVADGKPGAGGSTVLVQRWVTDNLEAFENLTIAEQESVFGRTKPGSIQLSPLPIDSHVARNLLVENGVELDIYRRNIAFGSVAERGYMFVGFAADQSRVFRMLERMYGVDADAATPGVVDALTRYTRPVSNSAYFVPALQSLTSVGAAPPAG